MGLPRLTLLKCDDARAEFISRQFSYLRTSGISADEAASMLVVHFPPAQVESARASFENLDNQNVVLMAMRRHADGLGLTEPETVYAYEQMARFMVDVQRALASTLRGMPIYITGVILVGLLVSSILLMFVIPQFESLFKSFGAELPALTQLVIGSAGVGPLLLLLAIAGLVWLGIETTVLKKMLRHRHIPDRYSWKWPIFGSVARLHYDLVHLWLVDLLLSRQREPAEALKIAETVMRDVSPKLSLDGNDSSMLARDLQISLQLGALQREVSERTEFMLLELPARVDAQGRSITLLVQAILGVMIGTMVIGMYLPIFKLGALI